MCKVSLEVLIIDNLVKKFDEYYYKYLGYDDKNSFFCSKNDNFKVNGFMYPMIISYYKDNVICSLSNEYYGSMKNTFEIDKNVFEIEKYLTDFFSKADENFVIQRMKRMSKIKDANISISDVTCISEEYKKFFFNSFIHNKDEEYKQLKWEKLQKNKYINGIIKDNKIVSLGFVSNINCGGANIVIQTVEEYRNNGYGKKIVEKISQDLLRDGILPIYWVNEKNIASMRLAESIGFQTKATEIVVKYEA